MAFAKVIFRCCILLPAAGAVVGCNGPGLIDRLKAEDPRTRLIAIQEAGEKGNRQALPYLVAMLSDEEGDVRLFSVGALREITGESMGYHSYDPPAKRAAAQQQWRQWLNEQGPAAGAPSQSAGSPDGEEHE